MIVAKNLDTSIFGHFHNIPKEETNDIKQRFVKHVHTYRCELLYFLKGKASFNIEGNQRELKPGDCIFVPSGKYHCISVDERQDYERFVIEFYLQKIPFSSSLDISSLAGFYHNSELDISNILYEIEEKVGKYKEEEFQDYFYASIGKILYLLSLSPKSQETQKENMLSSILTYLKDHIYEDIQIEDLSLQFHMNPTALNRYFKTQMDVSLHHYIKNMKMQKAYNLLLSGKKPEEIYQILGYNDYSTFYRCFVSTFSLSPKQVKI